MYLAINMLSLVLAILSASAAFVAITWRERAFTWIAKRPWVAYLLWGGVL